MAQMVLDDRKASILKAIVEEYVAFGHPVGSASVTSKAHLPVSSATVRNEMTVLEAQGYISQPHTSAGRIPTDLGYRYYVDHLAGPVRLPGADRAAVTGFFAQAHREIEEMLTATSRLLSKLTAYAAVVIAPRFEGSRVRDVHLVSLTPGAILAVMVTNAGKVEKYMVENLRTDQDDLRRASQVLTESLRGWSLIEPAPALPGTGRSTADDLAAQVLAQLVSRPDEETAGLYLGGAFNLVAEGAEREEVQHVLEALERQAAIVSMLWEALADTDLVVRIGSENPIPEMREWSLVTAPYRAGRTPLGAVGVVGPTRMNYVRAISAVEAVSAGLGAAFGSLGSE